MLKLIARALVIGLLAFDEFRAELRIAGCK
jgi:hypothetical protein